jgi:hypothetical protein
MASIFFILVPFSLWAGAAFSPPPYRAYKHAACQLSGGRKCAGSPNAAVIAQK